MAEHKSTYMVWGVLALVATALIAVSSNGFFVHKSEVSLLSLPKDTTIFIDEGMGMTTTEFTATTTRLLAPGIHSFILSSSGYYPWEKTIKVAEDGPSILHPLFVPDNPVFTTLPKTDPSYQSISALFPKTPPATITSPSGNVVLSLADNTISAEWKGGPLSTLPTFFCKDDGCDTPHIVLSSSIDHITSILFYPGREDVALFVIGNTVAAREIDARTTQNYYPIYQGVSPEIAEKDGTLFIRDGTNIFSVNL